MHWPGWLVLVPAALATTTPAAAEPGAHRESAVLPADSDAPTRPGYHREHRRRLGLVISGAIVGGIGVGSLGIGAYKDVTDDRSAMMPSGVFYAVGVVCLAVGIPLFTVGMLSKRSVDVRNAATVGPSTHYAMAPWIGQHGGGVQVAGAF